MADAIGPAGGAGTKGFAEMTFGRSDGSRFGSTVKWLRVLGRITLKLSQLWVSVMAQNSTFRRFVKRWLAGSTGISENITDKGPHDFFAVKP